MRRTRFSSFSYNDVLRTLGVTTLTLWQISAPAVTLTEFFQRRLQRLDGFDLIASERGKELIIDAFCEEALESHAELKIWKEAAVRGTETTGFVDYLVAPRRAYLGTPLLCVVEAKKDDFEQGTAQCLVGMEACAERNAADGITAEVYGIVSNGQGWQFLRRDTAPHYSQSGLYTTRQPEEVLGALNHVFGLCAATARQATAGERTEE